MRVASRECEGVHAGEGRRRHQAAHPHISQVGGGAVAVHVGGRRVRGAVTGVRRRSVGAVAPRRYRVRLATRVA